MNAKIPGAAALCILVQRDFAKGSGASVVCFSHVGKSIEMNGAVLHAMCACSVTSTLYKNSLSANAFCYEIKLPKGGTQCLIEEGAGGGLSPPPQISFMPPPGPVTLVRGRGALLSLGNAESARLHSAQPQGRTVCEGMTEGSDGGDGPPMCRGDSDVMGANV